MKKIAVAIAGALLALTACDGSAIPPIDTQTPNPAVFLEQSRKAAPSLEEYADAELLAEADEICAALHDSHDRAAELLIDHLQSGDYVWTEAEVHALWQNASAYLCPARTEQFGFLMQ